MVTVPNATELFTLRWSTVSYVYFTTILKSNIKCRICPFHHLRLVLASHILTCLADPPLWPLHHCCQVSTQQSCPFSIQHTPGTSFPRDRSPSPPVATGPARPAPVPSVFPSLTLLQPHRPPHSSSNTPDTVLPQGLCTGSARCLESPWPRCLLLFFGPLLKSRVCNKSRIQSWPLPKPPTRDIARMSLSHTIQQKLHESRSWGLVCFVVPSAQTADLQLEGRA